MPSTLIYSNNFNWNNVATVNETVTYDDPSHPGQYLWNFHLTNNTFSSGIANFAVPAEVATMASNLGSSVGWMGSAGAFMGNMDLIAWQAGGGIIVPPPNPGNPPPPPGPGPALLNIGDSADFWFTTVPTDYAESNGLIAGTNLPANNNINLLPGGLLAVPVAAPVPAPIPPGGAPNPLPVAPAPRLVGIVVSTQSDKADRNDGLTSLREAIDWVNDKKLLNRQLQVRFAKDVTVITLGQKEELPNIENGTSIFINPVGQVGQRVTIQRDAVWGNFRLLRGDEGSTMKIVGLNLTNGGGEGFNGNGGAVLTHGDLTLQNCWLFNNETDLFGGGVYVAGSLDMKDCLIQHNIAGLNGGGVYAANSLTLKGGQVFLNEAVKGGGIYAAAGLVTVEDASIFLNQAVVPFGETAIGDGGGMFIGDRVSIAIITDTTITYNSAIGGGGGSNGGGNYIVGGSEEHNVTTDVTLRNCQINWNRAVPGGAAVSEAGGGVAAMGGVLHVISTTLSDNDADMGGGVYLGPKIQAANFSNSSVIGTTASTSGGGVWIQVPAQGPAPVTIIVDDTWIVGNFAASQGGGIGVGSPPTGGNPGGALQLTLQGNTLIGFNTLTAADSVGGGLFLGYGTVTFNGVTFQNDVTGNWAATGFYAASGTGVLGIDDEANFINDTWFIQT